MSAYIKYPEEIQKCIDIYDPYGSQIANGELDKLPQEVIDSFFDGEPKTPLWYLGESIKLLGQADIAYFCKDWEKYRGCCIEHECCVRYSIKHVEE